MRNFENVFFEEAIFENILINAQASSHFVVARRYAPKHILEIW